jgi:hypothetical protein
MKKEIFCLGLLTMLISASCNPKTEQVTGCQPPPKSFSELSLVGTWHSMSPAASDTLIIKADNTYKQIIHMLVDGIAFYYESDWQTWWLEEQENEIPHLHLSGYRVCAYWPEITCETEGGGDGYWTDFCQEKRVEMDGEGIFLVLGAIGAPNSVGLSLLSRGEYDVWNFWMVASDLLTPSVVHR